jgi:hypothetical protein
VIALVLFGAGTAYFLAIQVVPLLVRTINPTYAARTIEEATPALKNSLINFLLLRQDRSGIREIIYQAVERQAASDIADVPVEATVDRTHLLRAGYVLCGVMAVFAAYSSTGAPQETNRHETRQRQDRTGRSRSAPRRKGDRDAALAQPDADFDRGLRRPRHWPSAQ